MSIFIDKKLEELVPYTPGEQPKGIDGLIKLNTNESPFPPSDKVIEAISSSIVSNLQLYSDPTCSRAISAIALRYGVKNEMVFLGNGSDEVLAFIFHGLCPDGAVFADISYGFYKVFASMFGVRTTVIPLDGDFRINTDEYRNIKGTVFVANPNAPTGIFLPLSKIEELLEQDKSRLVVIDEAYVDFGGESAVKLLDRYNNLIVVQTFSKSRSLAGARLGFALASEELINDLNRMKFSFNPYNVNTLSLLAAEAAMRDEDYFEECRRVIIENRGYITDRLRSLGFRVLDSSANFVFAGQNGRINAADYYKALRQNKILVRYFPEGRINGFVRITVGTKEQMENLYDVTKNILKGC
ncbi:MAG: histidinol-phosphate transaminase [Firmicutes bacterium HGW-Firmicutes-21]|nr:MAG: histidinol-phosphate transaminase [Firmicutes bacterium HGW-Firmicutes-21]